MGICKGLPCSGPLATPELLKLESLWSPSRQTTVLRRSKQKAFLFLQLSVLTSGREALRQYSESTV